jgi:hypothetical protein
MAMTMELDDLPTLTTKQTTFINALLKGKTASDAYKAAYDCSNMADRTIWSEASRLRANPKSLHGWAHLQTDRATNRDGDNGDSSRRACARA